MSYAVADSWSWTDRKRYLWILGLIVPALPFYALAGYREGWDWMLWAGPILIFTVIPLLDVIAGLDPENPPDEVIDQLEGDRYYRWVVYLFLPLQYVGLVLGVAMLAGHSLGGLLPEFDMSVIDKVGLACTLGIVGGIGINTAHELGHKKESVERWLSKIALAQCFYGHFYIEHNRGHHVRVATPEDPASSRLGESFYRFWPRTVLGSLRSGWEVEARRYRRKGTHPFHLGNDVLNAWLMSVALWVVLLAVFGLGVLPYLLLQAVVSFSLLEVVNYLEHYGMLRQKVGPEGRQRYERVSPRHSWNSNNLVTNVFLYHLQRHSDHHANPTRRYQALRDFDEAPALPTGYAGMIILALVPPLWRRVMDPRVVAHVDGDLELANIQPGKEERYRRLFPAREHEDVVLDDVTVQQFSTEVLAARCPGCEYVYEVAAGDEHEGFPAGTAWSEIPDDWCCPDCGVREKVDFVPVDPDTLGVASVTPPRSN